MKNLVCYFLIAILVVFSYSCEKVIEIPLNDADQEIVVEAVARNFVGESYVLLSKTGSVYAEEGFEKLSGATVTITDNSGVETIFTEDPEQLGKYIAPSFLTVPNETYKLNVKYEDKVITSSCKTQSLPKIDSLTFIEQVPAFGPSAGDTSLLVFYHFVDNGDETNYYRFRLWVNGVADNNYYIGDDQLGNGQYISAPFFATEVKSKDTLHVELQSIDEANYTYLFTLANNLNQSPFSATPSNPVSNIENAIGYFSASTIDSLTVIFP